MNQSVIYGADDLRSRLRATVAEGKRFAYCVGSGLTAPKVPGVARALELMRYGFSSEEDDREAFARAVEGLSGGPAYQAAARLILGRRGQPALNRVVREMVLNAHGPTLTRLGDGSGFGPDDFTNEYCEAAESELDAWYVPEPVARLGELLAGQAEEGSVSVLTTNFDPLIEIAVRRARGTALPMKFDQDGKLDDFVAGHEVLVAHLHGFWRAGDTLHAAAQLTQERPLLRRSLERLFADRTVVVSGYGGWDDVVTASLTEASRVHERGELDVLWVFREADPRLVALDNEELLREFAPAAGHVTFFAGADCEAVVSLVAEAEAEARQQGDEAKESFSSPLKGWTAVTASFLERQRAVATEDELVRFFDGQVPTWRHGRADGIPKLEPARRGIEAVAEAGDAGQSSLLLLLGPSGEGKSLAALQTGAHYAQAEGWRVMWREAGVEAPIEVDALAAGDWRWLLIVDDADADIRRCLSGLRRLHDLGRDDVVFLLAARTADWRAEGGEAKPWSELGSFVSLETKGLLPEDAAAIVGAWEAAGPAGLGEFTGLDGKEARTQVLLDAARSEASSPEGSLFGAMLEVRVGEGLRDHVRTLGERLRERHVSSGRSLLQAFLYVAAVHSHGILSLRPRTLAAALDIPTGDVYREVVWPLGEEAALSASGTWLRVRHRSIAETAMGLLDVWGEDPAEIYYGIIRAAAQVRRDGNKVPHLPDFVYLSTRLTDTPRVAVRAAEAPVDVEPERLSYWTTLASVLRKTKDPEAGVERMKEAYAKAEFANDKENLRGVLHEWAVCAGVLRRPAVNAYLCLYGMADGLPIDPDPASDEAIGFLAQGVAVSLPLVSAADGSPGWAREATAAAEAVRRAAEERVAVEDVDAATAALSQAGRELRSRLEEDLPEPIVAAAPELRFSGLGKYAG